MPGKSALDVIYGLPQAAYLPESRIQHFLKRVELLKEDPLWHARRLSKIGGSEIGAFLREHFPTFQAAPGDSFKTAEQIIAEKLLRQLPQRDTIQTARGTGIEPLLRDVFRGKYGLTVFAEGFEATKEHKTAPLGGSCDDSLLTETKSKLIVDYKSSTQSYDVLPFDHVVSVRRSQVDRTTPVVR